jgi:hypothetical protein
MRNALAQAFKDTINAGAGSPQLRIKDGANTAVTFNLNSTDAFGSPGTPGAGQIAAASVPISANASSSQPEVDNYELTDADGNIEVTGTVGTAGADIIVDNQNIAENQEVILNSLVVTIPASPS